MNKNNTVPAYTQGKHAFWDDEHISKGMLEAHLDESHPGASRTPAFIAKSCGFIAELSAPVGDKQLLDLGCGPGLYCEGLHDRGFHVTGVDISRRSICYGQKRAAETGRDIVYRQMDYRDLDYRAHFDAAIMIYCDFGVLSPADGKQVVEGIAKGLRPGGFFLFDAWTDVFLAGFTQGVTEYETEGASFWSPYPHRVVQTNQLYPDGIYLEQYVVTDKGGKRIYYNWNRAFSPEDIRQMAADAGFSRVEIYGDVTGRAYCADSETVAALCIL